MGQLAKGAAVSVTLRRFSRREVASLPTLGALVRNARRPEMRGAYVPRNGVGFLALRADDAVVELFFGPLGGFRSRVVGWAGTHRPAAVRGGAK